VSSSRPAFDHPRPQTSSEGSTTIPESYALLFVVTLEQALNCILRCGPKTGGIKTGRPKKFKKEQIDRMVQLLEQGLEMTVPDSAGNRDAGRAGAKKSAPNKSSALEIMDVDGCCVLCGGAGADLLCTFPCPSASTEADADGNGIVSVCGCM
jgi:hypothetical protein